VKALAERCAAIRLLVLDVDGVLTAGGIQYAADGTELKTFHVRDGSALKLWRQTGRRVAILSGRSSRVVEVRAAELGIDLVVQGAGDKLAAFREVLTKTGDRPEQTAFVGDDLPDLPVLRNSGLAVAVADACADVRADAHYVTRARGGMGAVREAVELVLRCQGEWQQAVRRLREETL
jgi:3-deoxy-D-manno-octulosonate 8-phosphate phosphatase (KDO 8-P phosphatase)